MKRGVFYSNYLHFPSFLVKIDLISSIWYTIQKSGHMLLKGVNCVHNDKIRSSGLERSNFSTQCKNQIIWSLKESIGYTIQKSGHMVFKGVNWGTQYKNQVKWS